MAADVTIKAMNHPVRNSAPAGTRHATAPVPTRWRRVLTVTVEAGNREAIDAIRRSPLDLNRTAIPTARGETPERARRSAKRTVKLYLPDRQAAASHADLENITLPGENTGHPRRTSDRSLARVLGRLIEAHGGTIQSGGRPRWRDEGAHASMRCLRLVMI